MECRDGHCAFDSVAVVRRPATDSTAVSYEANISGASAKAFSGNRQRFILARTGSAVATF
jgi:hypothetical protein